MTDEIDQSPNRSSMTLAEAGDSERLVGRIMFGDLIFRCNWTKSVRWDLALWQSRRFSGSAGSSADLAIRVRFEVNCGNFPTVVQAEQSKHAGLGPLQSRTVDECPTQKGGADE